MSKYTVTEPRRLSSWKKYANDEIAHWLDDEAYRNEIMRTTMKEEYMGPFTKFLYAFACKCEAPWGVMIDFNEHKQRVFLVDKYYKWMHEIRDGLISMREENEQNSSTNLNGAIATEAK